MLDADTIYAFLRKNTFFDDMSDEALRKLITLASERRYAAGETFMTSGEDADFMGAIYSGTGELGVKSEEHFVVVDQLARHRVIGWSAMVPPYKWSFHARTTSDLLFIAFDARELREMCEADHEFGVEVMTCMAKTITQRLMATRMALLNSAS